MTNLLKWLEPTIIKQVDAIAERVESDIEVAASVEIIEKNYESLMKLLANEEHQEMLKEIDSQIGQIMWKIQYLSFCEGLIEGITMQQEINNYSKGGR